MRTGKAIRIVIVGAVVALALAGCGRKGALQPPPGAAEPPPPAEGEVVRPGPRPTNPDRPFILDRIL